MNSCIPEETGTVSYDTVDTAPSLIQLVGPGVVLAKTEIEHAYKLICIHTYITYQLWESEGLDVQFFWLFLKPCFSSPGPIAVSLCHMFWVIF